MPVFVPKLSIDTLYVLKLSYSVYRWPCLVLVCCTRWVLKDNTVHKGRKALEAGEHICAPNHASNPPLSGKLYYETVTNSLKAHTSVISLEIIQKNCVLIIVPVGSISAV